MTIFIQNKITKQKIINWHIIHHNILKLQNQIVQQIKKQNFRKVRNLQRLILKSLSSQLLISQKILKTKKIHKFNLYKNNRNDFFLNLLNLNNYLQFKNYMWLKSTYNSLNHSAYWEFLTLLWVLALMPMNETLTDTFFYNHRLYRDETDILREFCSIFNFTSFKWLLIIRPTGFFSNRNKKWIFENILMEKKFLLFILKSKKFANTSRKHYNYHKEILETKQISLEKLLKNTSFYNFSLNNEENMPYTPVIFYSDLILIPSTNLNQFKDIYKSVFKFLKVRGLSIRKNRIWVLNLVNGFNFLGWFLKKREGKITFQINRENIKSHQLEIKKFLKSSRFLSMEEVIYRLNKKIINWQQYYSYASNVYNIWREMNYYLFWRIWRWCKKRHKNKGSKWLYHRYWMSNENKKWLFHVNDQYLNSYYFKKRRIIPLSASINVCEIKNWKKSQEILLKKN